MIRLAKIAVCASLLCLLCACATKSILLVTEYEDASPRAASVRKAIDAQLRLEGAVFNLADFNMNLVGRTSDVWREQMGHVAVVRTDALQADVVLIAGDEAVRYFGRRLLGKPKRIIFFDVCDAELVRPLVESGQATGIIEEPPVQEAFALMKRLMPQAVGAAVLADRSARGDVIVARIEAATDLPIRVTEIRRAGTLQEWMTALKELQDRADVLCIAACSTVLTDAKSTVAVPEADLLRMTAEANRLPDFGFDAESVGPKGLLAAVATPVDTQAALAAQIAGNLLFRSWNIARIPVTTLHQPGTLVDATRAAALGIRLENLAPK